MIRILGELDLVFALEGAPVRLRDGSKAAVLGVRTGVGIRYPVRGKFTSPNDPRFRRAIWTLRGEAPAPNSHLDIVGMWEDPLTFDYWEFLAPEVQFLARDADGRWYGYTHRPTPGVGVWDLAHHASAIFPIAGVSRDIFPVTDRPWQDTLIERPEEAE